MLLERLRTKRCQKSTTTSRSRCRRGKSLARGCRYPIMVIDWAGGGNGYEEVNRGVSMVISMATRPGLFKRWIALSNVWTTGARELRIKKTQTLLLFKEVSFLLFFSGLNASLRSVSFSWRRKRPERGSQEVLRMRPGRRLVQMIGRSRACKK